MASELRTLRDTEWDNWSNALNRAFGGLPLPEENRGLQRAVTEPERSFGLWDDGDCVATAGAFSFGLTVPGGAEVPAAGVTAVSVRSTHRRRGLLRSMRHQLADVRERGEPPAVLTSSEPAIYGRFGYGPAAQDMRPAVDTVRLPAPGHPAGGRCAAAPRPGHAAVRHPAGRVVVRPSGGGGRGAGGADVPDAGGGGAGGVGPVLPVERGALAAVRRRGGRRLRADHGPGRTGAVRTGAGVGLSGRVSLRAPAAGRVRELRPGAPAGAARAFGSEVAPSLPHGF